MGTAIPVYEGVPILAAWQAQPLAGEAVEAAVRADLVCRGRVTRGDGGELEQLDPELLTPAEAKEGLANWLSKDAAPTVVVPCGGDKLLQVDGITREASAELLWALDEDKMSVACIILDAIAASPIDCRSTLAESLVLVGGTAMMRGFKSRLSQELKSLVATPKYQILKINNFKLFQPPAQLNYVSWLGGAIFGATDVVVTRSLSREQYLRDPAVPDWANLRFNTQHLEERQGS